MVGDALWDFLRRVIKSDEGVLHEVTEGVKDGEEVCYIAAKAVCDEYEQDLRARGENKPLDLGDLRREISKEPYWIQAPTKEPRTHTARINGSQQACWVISLTKFVFGEDLKELLEPTHSESEIEKPTETCATNRPIVTYGTSPAPAPQTHIFFRVVPYVTLAFSKGRTFSTRHQNLYPCKRLIRPHLHKWVEW